MIYLISWKFVCDLRFLQVLQATIIRQILKENEEMEKIEKYGQKLLELCTNFYVCGGAYFSISSFSFVICLMIVVCKTS